jgi:hypothetical protein
MSSSHSVSPQALSEIRVEWGEEEKRSGKRTIAPKHMIIEKCPPIGCGDRASVPSSRSSDNLPRRTKVGVAYDSRGTLEQRRYGGKR